MELLAPAGTLDCVKAAVNSGADAVYFAGKSFGARSYAGNLTDDEILFATDFCHLRDVKTYVTVNTIVFDREYKELYNFIKLLTKAGVDGVIVQDLGVLSLIRDASPNIELHGSTQMTVHSADGVRELEKSGVSRVVLSRELSGNEIKDICNSVNAEIEVFVHGAMCMSYSGQCLMSSVIGGRSGNRGKCAQPCRLTFSPNTNKKEQHFLSLKDMSYANYIPSLSEYGVASLKIEGRMKGAEYVSSVVSAYRKFIDENRKPSEKEFERLNSVFFRGGLSDGYYTGKIGKDMFAFDKPDNPYLKNNGQEESFDDKQVSVSADAKIVVGEKPMLSLSHKDAFVTVFGDNEVDVAKNSPTEFENARKQLSKTGGTAFKFSDLKLEMSENAFIPISSLNELRRKAISELETEILKKYNKKFVDINIKYCKKNEIAEMKYSCSVLNMKSFRVVAKFDYSHIYIPLNIVEDNIDELIKYSDRIVVSPPVIVREKDRNSIKNRMQRLSEAGFDKAEVMTIDGIELCEGYRMFGSQRLNISNAYALSEYKKIGFENVCLSAEINLAMIRDISKSTDIKTEIVGYGKIPIMITENCIMKNMGNCKCNGNGKMLDRTGTEFTIIKDGKSCRNVVLNSVPIYTADKISDLRGCGTNFVRLIFTDEDENMIKNVSENYFSGNDTLKDKIKYTRLHLFKSATL